MTFPPVREGREARSRSNACTRRSRNNLQHLRATPTFLLLRAQRARSIRLNEWFAPGLTGKKAAPAEVHVPGKVRTTSQLSPRPLADTVLQNSGFPDPDR